MKAAAEKNESTEEEKGRVQPTRQRTVKLQVDDRHSGQSVKLFTH